MKQKLSEELIEKCENLVFWEWISAKQDLSEEFIKKFRNRVDWYYIMNSPINKNKVRTRPEEKKK